jgi:hypothetical protein
MKICVVALLLANLARADEPVVDPDPQPVANGTHWRIVTPAGPVHVWRPQKFEPESAGIVVYVHGYYTDADHTWIDDKLADQFDLSGQNATFIVPEAPRTMDDDLMWPSLGDLFRAVKKATRIRLPDEPIVLVGHSAAYRTLLAWLDYPGVDTLIMADALYGNEEDFFNWLTAMKNHWGNRMTIVSFDTKRWAEPFWRRFPKKQVETLDEIPDSYDKLTDAQKKARILYVRTATEHMHIIPDEKILPIVLRRSPLKSLAPPTTLPTTEPAATTQP